MREGFEGLERRFERYADGADVPGNSTGENNS
jgi:hypothetical protein